MQRSRKGAPRNEVGRAKRLYSMQPMRRHDWRLNAALQLLGRVFVPWYFLRCVAVDAGGKGWLPLWDGVWSAHENWHCAILVLHCLQLHAVSTYHDGESAFVTFLEVVGGSGVLKT